MALATAPTPPSVTIPQESILVVKRDILFQSKDVWQGINTTHTSTILESITQHKEFLPRAAMEEDPRYKQIIPYVIFTHENRYFLMQRRATSSEQRLKNKYSLGIGGHMRAEDLAAGDTLFDWAHREFHEEISYTDALSFKTLGILNDDSNPVGQVHLGIVLLAQGNSENITIKSELKSGALMTLGECKEHFTDLESWSQIVYNHLTTESGG